jgi:hypothetical protein
LNLRPSGYEAAQAGVQTPSAATKASESLDVPTEHSAVLMQQDTGEHKNFGQPVVSDEEQVLNGDTPCPLLTPAQAAARFQVPEYVVRKACAEGRLEHLRVVNALLISPAALAVFTRAWRARKRPDS